MRSLNWLRHYCFCFFRDCSQAPGKEKGRPQATLDVLSLASSSLSVNSPVLARFLDENAVDWLNSSTITLQQASLPASGRYLAHRWNQAGLRTLVQDVASIP